MFHITQVNMTWTAAKEIDAPCGGARRARPRRTQVAWAGQTGAGTGRSAENHLPMGLGRADSLHGREAVGDNAQPMGGWAKRGHFKSAQINRGCFAALCTARSYEQLASLNAPEAVIALVDRQEAVPLNWT